MLRQTVGEQMKQVVRAEVQILAVLVFVLPEVGVVLPAEKLPGT